jgi:hypothetical protein
MTKTEIDRFSHTASGAATCAALRDSASEFGTLEVQKIAQNPEQWHVVGSLYRVGVPIDVERYHLSSL